MAREDYNSISERTYQPSGISKDQIRLEALIKEAERRILDRKRWDTWHAGGWPDEHIRVSPNDK